MKSAKTIPFLSAALCVVLSSCGVEPIPYDGPLDPVAILEFSASSAKIRAGESASLSWSTRDALFVQVSDHTGAVVGDDDLGVTVGTLEVTPRRTTRYTLAAFGASGAQRYSEVKVEVDLAGTAPTLTAAKKRIDLGAATRLEWKAPSAVSARLLAGEKVLLEDAGQEGSLDVSPEHTTSYTLEATGVAGITSSAEAKVEVAPVISYFRASPAGPQLEDTKVLLFWKTHGADAVRLKGDGAEYAAPEDQIELGAWQVQAGAGKIVLIASRDGVEATAELAVDILVAPTIDRFEVKPGAVTAGPGREAKVEVSWKVTGAAEIVLRRSDDEVPVRLLEAEGKREFSVTASTAFTLQAINPAGEVSKEVAVSAIPPAIVETFEASTTEVGAGEAFRITWSTSGAIFVDLQKDGTSIRETDLGPAGEIELQVDKTTIFRLVAINEAGAETTSDALEVKVLPPATE